MRLRLCWSASAWITTPTPRKSRALKNAWVSRWNIELPYRPRPAAMIMYPIWLTVLQASTRLMSSWTKAIVAATNSVSAPTTATMSPAYGASS